ncbi:16S rRNA (cytosine(1402)-N(4))-methyltransferase RsmH [Rarobacter incanus]|uniref:Ribosomal RNA small subunit methyltransferase H n=1 Tax=Rarobacter incanus TaxID=153494 RepID=A0A542SLI2_9MICO|nr:16S rRNA (cytosine(1402)-N(4))-methyltransferase RsmH [Rarobacter incanus]TQK75489.1 16S rRNA (cytosine1402-N4)-methyltransferase [Rarobacter incanus]
MSESSIDRDDITGKHVPVLLEPTLELLAPSLDAPGAILVDGTLGLGGHTEAVLRRFPGASVIGIDRDPRALELASQRLSPFGNRFTPVRSTYDNIYDILADRGIPGAQAVLLDLGVSSMQIDEAERGFSYRTDAPLDMRMDPTLPTTAAQILNTYSVGELTRILREYGEERYANRIANRIVERRAVEQWVSSGPLVDLIRGAIPAASRKTGGNPAKRTFQALRIEVNAELEILSNTIPAAVDALAVGGRIAVMSYHSLEDRIVKRTFARAATSNAPRGIPLELAADQPYLRLITRGAMKAPADEVMENPRAASVRLRVAERTRETSPQRERKDA